MPPLVLQNDFLVRQSKSKQFLHRSQGILVRLNEIYWLYYAKKDGYYLCSNVVASKNSRWPVCVVCSRLSNEINAHPRLSKWYQFEDHRHWDVTNPNILVLSFHLASDFQNKLSALRKEICISYGQFTLSFASWPDHDPTNILPGRGRIAQCELLLLTSRPGRSWRSGAYRRLTVTRPGGIPTRWNFGRRCEPAGRIRRPGRSRGHLMWRFQPISTGTV